MPDEASVDAEEAWRTAKGEAEDGEDEVESYVEEDG